MKGTAAVITHFRLGKGYCIENTTWQMTNAWTGRMNSITGWTCLKLKTEIANPAIKNE